MSKGQWYTPFSHNWTLVMASLSPVLLRVETQQCLVWPQPWLSTPPPLIWKPQFCTTTVSLAGVPQSSQTETSGLLTDPWGLGASCSSPSSSLTIHIALSPQLPHTGIEPPASILPEVEMWSWHNRFLLSASALSLSWVFHHLSKHLCRFLG